MKAKIKKIRSANIEIEGVDRGEFRLVSKWESFEKYQNEAGEVLILTTAGEGPMAFSAVFGEIFEDDDAAERLVVKASPCLYPAKSKQ